MNVLQKYDRFLWVLLLIPIYLFLFLKLGNTHIRLWDEGWFAVHAVEMLQQNSFFVSFFNGEPSVMSTKPPLQTWLQMASLKLFGINELAIRIPSALAASATSLILFFWVRKHVNTVLALAASLVLLTSVGFVNFHTARTGDSDALLTLGLVLQSIVFYRLTITKNLTNVLLLGLTIGLTFWVKSTASLLLIPGLVVYLLVSNRKLFLDLLKSWQLYVGVLLAVSFIVGYLAIKQALQPSYFDFFMRSNVGRYTASVGHTQPLSYYLTNLLDGRYSWWLPIALIGLVASMFQSQALSGIPFYASILAVSYLAVISFSKSKLVWYDMPFYPFAAITTAFGVHKIIQGLKKPIIQRVTVLLMFAFPLISMFNHVQANKLSLPDLDLEAQESYLNKAFDAGKNLDGVKVLHNHYHSAIIFYKHQFASEGMEIIPTSKVDEIKENDQVLIERGRLFNQINKQFILDTIDANARVALVEVKSRN